MSECHIDFETRSMADLKKTGVHVYADHPSTNIHCIGYAFDNEPADVIAFELVEDSQYGELKPPVDDPRYQRVIDHVAAGGALVAHNAQFERVIWNAIMARRHGAPRTGYSQWRCTMAQGYTMALPGQLGQVAEALQVDQKKDWGGYRVMMQMAKPREIVRGKPVWYFNPEKRRKLYSYCGDDVEAERAIDRRILKLSKRETALFHLDQKINDRGVPVDVEMAKAARRIVETGQKRLDAEMRRASNYLVPNTRSVKKIGEFAARYDCHFDSLAADKLTQILEMDLPDPVRAVIEIRERANKASAAKIETLLRSTSEDGRCRGLFQYHGASTGRWGGRRFQPQNLKRPETKITPALLAAVATGEYDEVEFLFGNPLSIVGDTLRALICAPAGEKLVAADYSNIEGRVLAWLAGEEWKLEAFRKFDTFKLDANGQKIPDPDEKGEFLREGPDLYLVAAAGIYGTPIEKIGKKSSERQVGKVSELACGYQGGVGAFQSMARNYRVVVEDERADEIKTAWRNANPKIRSLWYDIEEAAMRAVSERGRETTCGPLRFKVTGSFLYMLLPSGRRLWYPYPSIKPRKMPWTNDDGKPVYKDQIHHWTLDSVSHKWVERAIYGGLLTENAVQAIARDILVSGMFKLEQNGYGIIMHVHDENVAECHSDFGSPGEMCEIMKDLPAWASGCPIAAEGYEAERYRK